MSDINWIMSDGGPLICMEPRFEALWEGISGLSAPSGNAKNDYERACAMPSYLAALPVGGGCAMVIGDAPLDTAFWQAETGQLFIVRVWFCEQDSDVDRAMRALKPSLFKTAREQLDFTISSSSLVMFDSAENGREAERKIVRSFLEPGHYKILTQVYDPDASCSLVLHRFDRLA